MQCIKINMLITDLKKMISIKFILVEHNLTEADISEKNNEAKQI